MCHFLFMTLMALIGFSSCLMLVIQNSKSYCREKWIESEIFSKNTSASGLIDSIEAWTVSQWLLTSSCKCQSLCDFVHKCEFKGKFVYMQWYHQVMLSVVMTSIETYYYRDSVRCTLIHITSTQKHTLLYRQTPLLQAWILTISMLHVQSSLAKPTGALSSKPFLLQPTLLKSEGFACNVPPCLLTIFSLVMNSLL